MWKVHDSVANRLLIPLKPSKEKYLDRMAARKQLMISCRAPPVADEDMILRLNPGDDGFVLWNAAVHSFFRAVGKGARQDGGAAAVLDEAVISDMAYDLGAARV